MIPLRGFMRLGSMDEIQMAPRTPKYTAHFQQLIDAPNVSEIRPLQAQTSFGKE
jgi:hypothetical protein